MNIIAVSVSARVGMRKHNVGEAHLREEFGIRGDAHAGEWNRQISLLACESIEKMRRLGIDVGPGDFAENITTEGVDLVSLPLGQRLRLGRQVLIEITQKGKECHGRCSIYHQVGHCVMPREGIFARVLTGGTIRPGDTIRLAETGETG